MITLKAKVIIASAGLLVAGSAAASSYVVSQPDPTPPAVVTPTAPTAAAVPADTAAPAPTPAPDGTVAPITAPATPPAADPAPAPAPAAAPAPDPAPPVQTDVIEPSANQTVTVTN
jgi:hypothetical protein